MIQHDLLQEPCSPPPLLAMGARPDEADSTEERPPRGRRLSIHGMDGSTFHWTLEESPTAARNEGGYVSLRDALCGV